MLVYRIIHKKYTDPFFAPGFPGRWNGAGRRVLYTAENLPLAFMENMIRRQGAGFNHDFKTLVFSVPDDLETETILAGDLPGDWRNFRSYSACQQRGNQWYDSGKTAILNVPSAVLPSSCNRVLNTTHPAFRQVKLAAETELIPDERIDALIKGREQRA